MAPCTFDMAYTGLNLDESANSEESDYEDAEEFTQVIRLGKKENEPWKKCQQ